jgi:predicted dienelactone hydrolase
MTLFSHVARRFCVLAALAASAGCGPAKTTPQAPTTMADVTDTGPFHVGYRKSSLTYRPPGETADRTINYLVWYPTNDTSGTTAVYDAMGAFTDDQAWDGASLAPPLTGGKYPAIEYSHGDKGVAGGAAYMMRHFASHGWVAMAPEHTGNTIWDSVDPHPIPLYFERATDMSAMLDTIEKLPSSDPLSGKVATDKVLLVGHSFGTFTVWSAAGASYNVDNIRSQCLPAATCTETELATFTKGVRDPRVIAGIPMAGTPGSDWFTDAGLANVHIPIFQMTGGANDVGGASLWARATTNDLAWIDIAGGCHETFNLVGYIGGCPTLDTDVGYKIVRTYAMAFARYHVLDDHGDVVTGIVNGTTKVSDLVTYKKKGQP